MTEPTSILFITTYVGLGGGETSLLTLVSHLDPAQFRPHLLVPQEGQLTALWRERGWPVHVQPFRGASVYFIPAIWASFPITGYIRQLIAQENIHLVHSDYHSLPYAVPASQQRDVPIIWTCWGWWFHPKAWQRQFFQQPQLTFAASWAIKEGFLGEPPFMSPEAVRVLVPGVDIQRFRPNIDGMMIRKEASIPEDAPLVAMIARFQDVKGHHTFQEMIRLVSHRVPNARFIVAGENVHGVSSDEAYKQDILRVASTDPILREKLVYLGFREDAERVIASADVIVCASRFESYGMVNVEAMASGKPVVSTRRGGPSETVVDGVTGFLVDPEDALSLADKVTLLLKDPDLRQNMGRAGRKRVEDLFSAQAQADTFTEAITPLIQR